MTQLISVHKMRKSFGFSPTDSLASNSDIFRNRAKALHKNMWWKNCRVSLDMVGLNFILIATNTQI